MRMLIPHHINSSHVDRLKAACEDGELSILHIERVQPLLGRIAAAGARRLLSYRAYEKVRRGLEASQLFLSIDGQGGQELEPIRGVEVLLCNWAFDEHIARLVIQALPDLRWVHSLVTGVDHFDLPLLAQRGIQLTSPHSIHARRIAEFTMALMYSDAKNLTQHAVATWRRRPRFMSSREMADLCVGIVGLGAIGQEVARSAKKNGMRVLGYTRQAARSSTSVEIELSTDLLQVLRESDVVVLALPLTPSTRGLIGEAELSAMKQDSMLINVGRGGTVVEQDLVNALRSRRIRRACIDVVEDSVSGRPAFAPPVNHPYFTLDNVLFTGYSTSESRNSEGELFSDFLDNLGRYTRGEPLHGAVDLGRGY